MLRHLVIVLITIAATSTSSPAAEKRLSDAQVKKEIIKESIAEYPGNCPCPYNVVRNGSMCGKRSAYSKPGGYAPICYPSDVTKEMILEWRESHSKPQQTNHSILEEQGR